MTGLAWGMLVLLVGLLALLVAQDGSIGGVLVLALVVLVWIGAGLLVQRDARRLGFADPDLAGGRVIVWGLPGLLWWFGYRRGRADAAGSE